MSSAGIIQSYGLFWRTEDVFWQTFKKRELLGVPRGARTSQPTNFSERVGIYVLYEGHRMIYVGQTGAGQNRLFQRLRTHTRDVYADRWDHFSWFGLRRPIRNGGLSSERMRAVSSIAKALDHMEAVLIAAAEPSLNKQGGRFGRNVRRFIQVRDERLGPTDSEMLRDLWDQSR